jgi:putative ABC transport system permease protein
VRFALLLAARELRQAWRKLLFFFLCVAIGVGSIVALRSLIGNLNRAVAGEARALLTADVMIESSRSWRAETLASINRIVDSPQVEARVETVELPTMLRPSEATSEAAMMVELRGVGRGYPLVGELNLQNGEQFRHELLDDNGAVVAVALLERLNLKIGDRVRIGDSTFQIRGVIVREPGGAGGFRLGPRVIIDRAAIEATGLVGFGSRARYKIFLRTPEGEMPSLVRLLRAELRDPLVNVRSYRESQENLSAEFSRAEDYLSLAGLVVLVLGGVGVSNVTRVFIEQKRKTIAVLKCLGARSRHITFAYLLQTLALGLAGSLLGILLAKLALIFVESRFTASLPPNLSYDLRGGAVWQGFALGILISFLFSILPLLGIRSVKPRTLLRDGGITDTELFMTTRKRRSFDFTRWTVAALVIVALVGIAAWQANSLRVGFLFLAGLIVAAGSLYAVAGVMINLLRRLSGQAKWTRSFPLRQAINSLHRPGNQTRVVVMAIGLGAFLVISTQALQANLIEEIDPARRGNLPDMFLIDIQIDQRAGVEEIITTATGERPQFVPVVRARIVGVNEREIDLERSERRERGRLGREYTVTYRPTLEANEEIVDGEFWNSEPAVVAANSEAEVSLEEGMRGLAGIDLGSRVTFDILGRRIQARVTSFRRVDWRNSRTGFLVLFRPGTLETAPQTFVAPVDAPADAAERARFQFAIVNRYPNISVIDVSEIVSSVRQILDNVTLAVWFVGAFIALSGALILAGSIAMTKYQRIYETAVLKTLGAERKTLLIILFAEYGLMGAVAGIIGALAAVALSYAMARFVFEIEWSFAPVINLAGILVTVALVVIIGALASFDVLMRKPITTLRSG